MGLWCSASWAGVILTPGCGGSPFTETALYEPEVCDGRDQDGDGRIDEHPIFGSVWFLDDDGDGYGDPNVGTITCGEPPEGFTSSFNDCDDTLPGVHPGATEVCNDLDDDCDGLIDSEDEDLTGGLRLYRDQDGDGHGDPATWRNFCDESEGWVYSDEDCDAADWGVHPGADERCRDGVVNDCDGSVRQAWRDRLVASSGPVGRGDTVELTGAVIADYAGASVAGPGDVDGDGWPDMVVGAPGHDAGGDDAGAVYVLRSSAGPLPPDAALEEVSLKLLGEGDGDQAGFSVAGVGDVDGDGLGDVLVGAPAHGEATGAAYLLLSSCALRVDTVIAGLMDADLKLVGEAPGDRAGHAVSGAGDLDGDGLGDLIVGAPSHDAGGTDAGAAYLLLSSGVIAEALGSRGCGEPPVSVELAEADIRLVGEAEGDQAGWSVAGAGSTLGDGRQDILVGAVASDVGSDNAGAAYLLRSAGALADGLSVPGARSLGLGEADYRLLGGWTDERVGHSVASAGDVDGDGLDDVLLGAIGHRTRGDAAGAVYLVHGDIMGEGLTGDVHLEYFHPVVVGQRDLDRAGQAVAGAGDLDGDGLSDVVAGASHYEPLSIADRGAVALLLSSETLRRPPERPVLEHADALLYGVGRGEGLGSAIAYVGDLDGDGIPEILVGAPSDGEGAGRVHVVNFAAW